MVTEEDSVPVSDAEFVDWDPSPADLAAVADPPDVVWPEPGTAHVTAVQAPIDVADSAALSAAVTSGPTAHAGGLPIWLHHPRQQNHPLRATAMPSSVDVELVDRGDDRLVLRVARTDGVTKATTVSLGIGYEEFRHAFGGDWASRLRLVELPQGCTSASPDDDECAGEPVATHNDGSGVLWADVDVSQSDTQYAVIAGPAGGAGRFTASKLSPAATWSVGDQAGNFNWSYPLDVPPAAAGPAPTVELTYSSGGVDGRTSSTNNQPSWAGEGFEITGGGSIERRYRQCSMDRGGNNGDRTVGDLCWATDNATLSLEGSSTDLVQVDGAQDDIWKPRADDGSRVERHTGATNGARDGEFWVVTAKNGTRYFFGLNRLPGWSAGKPETNSVRTVPVAGNHAGEPCHSAAFKDSFCDQAYRWNLDYVVDPWGNAMALFYETETNNYARDLTATSVSTYVRASHLVRIEYGHRDGHVFSRPADARVIFESEPRCIPGSACSTDAPQTFPDTPLDQACNSTDSCDNKFSPTFWTTRRLAGVRTQVHNGTDYTDVASWRLRHSFPAPGDGTRAGLWLNGITQTGLVGGELNAPEVRFDGIQMDNRVDGIDGIPAMKWWRVSAVHYGTGGSLAVAYSKPDCTVADLPEPATNERRCHPAKWTPDGLPEREDWFHKYVVTEVTESDRVSGLEPAVTEVEYLSKPAWRFDDVDGLVDIDQKTWSRWRGYDHVRVTKGHPDGEQSITETRYFRGMDGDRTQSGGQRSATITDSTGTSVRDAEPLSGQAREQVTYDGDTVVSREITDHWVSDPTATKEHPWGTTRAFKTEERAMRQTEALDDGAERVSGSENFYTDDGVLAMTADFGDIDDPDDDTCARYEYASNPAAGLLELPARKLVVAASCDADWGPDDVIEDERLYYDGADSHGAPPTRGAVTTAERLSGFGSDGEPRYQVVARLTYDHLGREKSVSNVLGHTATVAYTPASGGPLTRAKVTRPNGATVTTMLNPAWGEETAIIDEAGLRTDISHDPLGRTADVWAPGQRKNSDEPTFSYTYTQRADGANVVASTSLQADGSTETVYELFDGLLRPRQTQRPAPGGGRVIEDLIYDSRGLVVKENGPYYNDAPPNTDVAIPDEQALPRQKLTTYDRADRPLVEKLVSYGEVVQTTQYTYAGDRHTVVPPEGEAATTTFTSIRGLTSRIRHHNDADGALPDGDADFDETVYSYTPAGQLAAVLDPAGNEWAFEYDLRGRMVAEHDPDKGTTTYTYDDLDRRITQTDSRGETLAFGYDELGRKTSVRRDTVDGPPLAEWEYDTLLPGRLSSTTRWVDGAPYTVRVAGYDTAGRPTGQEVVLPETEDDLAGTYSTSHTYTDAGEVATTTLPAAGELPAETLRYEYTGEDLPVSMASELGTYVTETDYTPFGEVSTFVSEHAGRWVQHKYEYDVATRRLSRVVTERELRPRRVTNVSYTYDQAGNVTKINDEPAPGFDESPDTQCFTYDHRRRLTSAWTPENSDCSAEPSTGGLGGATPYWNEWTFDEIGNRLSETRHSATRTSTSTYSYPDGGANQPHALLGVETIDDDGGRRTDTYTYDSAGNLAERTRNGTAETFTWDAEGHLVEIATDEDATSFVYDADGNRLLRSDRAGTTLYLDHTEITLTGDGDVEGTRYYTHGEQVVATRTHDGLTWVTPDHHGTNHTAIEDDTQQVHRRRMDPYGNTRGAPPSAWPDNRGFVGGVHDPGTGLTHLEAREYDSTTGRFISVDPVADYSDPQQLHGYAYANNSPVTFTDPDGQAFFIVVVAIAVRAVPVVTRVAANVVSRVTTKAPVVRTVANNVVSKVKGFFGRLFSHITTIFRTFTQWVTRIITTIKRVIRTIRSMKNQIVRTVQRVPVNRVKAKPSSRAKQQARTNTRNTSTPKKTTQPKPSSNRQPRPSQPSSRPQRQPENKAPQQRPPSQSGPSSRSSDRADGPPDRTDPPSGDDATRRPNFDPWRDTTPLVERDPEWAHQLPKNNWQSRDPNPGTAGYPTGGLGRAARFGFLAGSALGIIKVFKEMDVF